MGRGAEYNFFFKEEIQMTDRHIKKTKTKTKTLNFSNH